MKDKETQFNISTFVNVRSCNEVKIELAKRFKKIRKEKRMTQKALSMISGISLGSIRLFEQKGDISLNSLLAIAEKLDLLDDFEQLFQKRKPLNLYGDDWNE